MATMQWDEKFLRDWERDEQDAALAKQLAEDWQTAVQMIDVARSDLQREFALCRHAICRRARRCARPDPVCREFLRELPRHVEQSLIDATYADLQRERRATVEAEGAGD